MEKSPESDSHIWEEMITGEKQIHLDFLAGMFLLGKLRILYSNNPMLISSLSERLFRLYDRHRHLLSAQKDIEQMKKEI